MLSWILIALIIAFIFGIIKVETIKEWAQKIIVVIKNISSIIYNWSKTKFEAVKKATENKKNTSK